MNQDAAKRGELNRALARGDIMKKGLCKWCESWERIAASGEVGTCLDPNNPNNLLATECEHPPDYWPGPVPASAPEGTK